MINREASLQISLFVCAPVSWSGMTISHRPLVTEVFNQLMLIITLYLGIDWLRQQAICTKGQCPLRMHYVMYWSSFPIDHRFFLCIFLSLVITNW